MLPFARPPHERKQLASEHLLTLLKDPAKWDEARAALQAPPLAPADFRTCFRTYSDADPEQHLAFDLYRIQAQEALKVKALLMMVRLRIVVLCDWRCPLVDSTRVSYIH